MATLSDVTQTTRGIIKWCVLAFLALLIFQIIVFPIGRFAFNIFFPKKPPPPTVAFGTLPQIPFPKKHASTNLTFEIKTTTGKLPSNIPTSLKVYAVAKRQAQFSSLDAAKKKVGSAGFTSQGQALSPIVYQWADSKIAGRQITFNIVTETFILNTPLASPLVEAKQPPPRSTRAVEIAKSFLTNIQLLPKDIDDKRTQTSFIKIRSGQLKKATSLAESDFVQVDFYRKPIADLLILNPNPHQALVSFLIKTESNQNKQIVRAVYSYKHINPATAATYPLKTILEAYEELKSGYAYIAYIEPTYSNIAIQKVYTAYYEGDDTLEYLMPIFVFEGEGFLAYVPAISKLYQQ